MKRTLQLGLIISLSLVLVACKKPVAAKEAATDLVNGLIYNKDVDKIKQDFTYEGETPKKDDTPNIVADLKETFSLDDSYDAQLKEMAKSLNTNLKEKTSFKVKVVKESKGKAKIEISIIGLEELSDEQLTKTLEAELEKKMADITAETTDDQINGMVNQISVSTMAAMIKEQQPKSKATTVNLELMTDAEDKSKWVIQNEDKFVTELFEAFGQ